MPDVLSPRDSAQFNQDLHCLSNLSALKFKTVMVYTLRIISEKKRITCVPE